MSILFTNIYLFFGIHLFWLYKSKYQVVKLAAIVHIDHLKQLSMQTSLDTIKTHATTAFT